MKKKIAITLIVAALLSLASTVEARDSWRSHKGGHHRGHATVQHHGNHHRRHAKHYRSSHHYRSRYANHSYRHHGRNSVRDGLKIAAGALIIGSVVRSINDHRSRQIAYRTAPANANRWYRIDPDGQCVAVRLNQYGEEVWTYTDAYCCY